MIPIAKPYIHECDIKRVINVLRSGNIAQGEKVKEFEKDFADYIGVKHAIATSNGTTALHAAIKSMGLPKGSEVLVPTFTFFSTASTVSMCGAKPIFVDVDKNTFNIDVKDLESKINHNTQGIVGVHLFGNPFNIYRVKQMCDRYGLFLIEDCAQAIGSEYRPRLDGGGMCGSFGDAGCFSFYATKNMTTGEGGMVTTNNDYTADHIRKFINHGQKQKYCHEFVGYNFRMTDIQAAIGIGQLKRLGENNAKRRSIAHTYDVNIRNDLGIIKPVANDQDSIHTYHQYVLRITEECKMDRDDFINYMTERNIGTAIHYPYPIHHQTVYEGLYWQYICMGKELCPVAEEICKEVVSIPVHPQLSWEDVKYIYDTINAVDQ